MKPVSIVLVCCCSALVLGASLPARADLGGPSGIMIPYRGTLMQNEDQPTSEQPYTFRFTIHDAADAGNECATQYEAMSQLYNGAFSIVIGPVEPTCVVGKPVFLSVEVKAAGAADFVALSGRQRVYPTLAAMTSGPGDFSAAGDLDAASVSTSGPVTAGTTLQSGSSLTVGTDAQVNGALTVSGDASVSGNLAVGGTGGNVPHACVVRVQTNSYVSQCQAGEIAVAGGGSCQSEYRIKANTPWGPGDQPAQDGQPAVAWRVVCEVWGTAGFLAYPVDGTYAVCCSQ